MDIDPSMAGEMAENPTRIADHQFKDEVFRSLNDLRNSKLLCDTTIRAEGKEFPAHRCVLSAGSLYFRGLFATELGESESNLIELQLLKCTAINEVLEFIYTGEATVNSSNAQDVIVAADYLIIPSLKAKASEFMENTINASNCLAMESFACQFHCDSLKRAALKYICQHFTCVVESEDFKTLEYNKVKMFISQDEIIVSKEEEVYEAVIRWVKHDMVSRESFFPELLKCVHIFSMSKFSLREIVANEELVLKNQECMSTVLKGMSSFLFSDDAGFRLLERPRLCLKTHEPVVVFTGGHVIPCQMYPPSRKTFGFLPATKQWVELPKMTVGRSRHAAAVCNGHLFVVGGQECAALSYYNPFHNKWCTKKDKMIPVRMGATLTTHKEEMYMIGGKKDSGIILHSVSKYSFQLNRWTDLSPMQFPRAAHCAVGLDGLIYIIAGQDNSVCLKCMECYDPSNDEWSQAPAMTNERKFAAAAATSGDKIIVVGGYADMECENLVESCEIFIKSTNEWNIVAGPIVPRAACGIVSIKDFVYLFGGEDGETEIGSVECYSFQGGTWHLIGNMPKPLTCLQASLLQLPMEYLREQLKVM